MNGVNIKGALSKDTVELKTKPTMLKNGISTGNIELSQAEKEFFAWLEKNAQAGRTYVSPEGHMVHGDDIIRSREFTKSITKKINLKNVTNLIKKVRAQSYSYDNIEKAHNYCEPFFYAHCYNIFKKLCRLPTEQ